MSAARRAKRVCVDGKTHIRSHKNRRSPSEQSITYTSRLPPHSLHRIIHTAFALAYKPPPSLMKAVNTYPTSLLHPNRSPLRTFASSFQGLSMRLTSSFVQPLYTTYLSILSPKVKTYAITPQ